MSTSLYLVCTDHDPPVQNDCESGQHLYDLPQLREDLANRELIVAAAGIYLYPQDCDSHRCNTARFLEQHPKCNLIIRDEYGREHPIAEEG